MEGGRGERREGGTEGGREGGREGGKEGGRDRGKEGGREGWMDEGRDKGERERERNERSFRVCTEILLNDAKRNDAKRNLIKIYINTEHSERERLNLFNHMVYSSVYI